MHGECTKKIEVTPVSPSSSLRCFREILPSLSMFRARCHKLTHNVVTDHYCHRNPNWNGIPRRPSTQHKLNFSQEQRNNLQNFILQLHEAISSINERILAIQAKILVLQTRRTQLGDVTPVSCHRFVFYLSKFLAKYLSMRLATARDMCWTSVPSVDCGDMHG